MGLGRMRELEREFQNNNLSGPAVVEGFATFINDFESKLRPWSLSYFSGALI